MGADGRCVDRCGHAATDPQPSGAEIYCSGSYDGSGTMNEGERVAALTSAELRDFRRLAGFMVPASSEYGVPGADDEIIFADIVRSLGRDTSAVRAALASLHKIAEGDFCGLDETKAELAAMTLLSDAGPIVTAVGRTVLQCYYRDDRVVQALGLETVPP